MSWSIYATGTKKGVQRAVEKHTTTADPDQYGPAKALILSEVEKIGDGKIVKLEASGSLYEGTRSLKIEINTLADFHNDPVV